LRNSISGYENKSDKKPKEIPINIPPITSVVQCSPRLIRDKSIIAVIAAVFLAVMKIRKASKPEEMFREVNPFRGDIAITVNTNGVVKPRNRLEIKPPVSGRIEEILVAEGNRVKKGQIIAWMSSTERAALLDTARARGEEELRGWSEVYKPAPIIAPLTGFIIKRVLEPGQTISMNDAILVMADDLIVQAQVDETDMGKLQKGQKVEISLDAYPGKPVPGAIEHIAYESEIINNVTIYQVDIKPLEKLEYLRSGMSATIEVEIAKKENALLLPAYAVIDGRKEKKVLVKSVSGKPDSVAVKTGMDNGENVEILSGIEDKDTVLIRFSKETDPRFAGRFGLPGMGGSRSSSGQNARTGQRNRQ